MKLVKIVVYDHLCFSLRALARTRRLSTPEEHRTGRHHASGFQAVEGERRAPLRFLRRRGSLRSIQVVRILGPAYETSGRRVLRGEPGECCTAVRHRYNLSRKFITTVLLVDPCVCWT